MIEVVSLPESQTKLKCLVTVLKEVGIDQYNADKEGYITKVKQLLHQQNDDSDTDYSDPDDEDRHYGNF